MMRRILRFMAIPVAAVLDFSIAVCERALMAQVHRGQRIDAGRY